MALEKLITDRTAADVAGRTAKGFYNLSDISRINSYIKYFSDELNLGLTIQNFSIGDTLTSARMQSIINNINAIRNAFLNIPGMPATPIPAAWNYSKANDTEKILQILGDYYVSYQIGKLYAGTFSAGSHIKFRATRATESPGVYQIGDILYIIKAPVVQSGDTLTIGGTT